LSVQNALDEFTVLWNAKNIRGPPTEKGHGGGVPNELFQHPVHPDIADQDFKEFPGALDYDVLRGSRHQGRLLPVHTGMYGASDPHDFDNPDEESLVETLHLTDPLQGCKQMCRVREYFLKSDQPEWTQYEVTPHTPKNGRILHHVERYLHLKYVNRQLLICVRDFHTGDGLYDWGAFGDSESNDGEDQGAYLRPFLASAAQSMGL